MLSLTIFLPLFFAFIILALPSSKYAKYTALAGSLITLILTIILTYQYSLNEGLFRLIDKASWIPSFNIFYQVGLDSISLPLFILTSLLSFLVIVYHFNINVQAKKFFPLLLFLETAMLGTFSALDLILFYIFFELCLVPMYFLIGIWGGQNKKYAAIKFFLYTLFGSLLILLGFLIMYRYTKTFDYISILSNTQVLNINNNLIYAAITLLLVGFGIKVPSVPFHTWLPDAHTEAPTGGSVLLAGILLKMGVYGIIRFIIPIFPQIEKFSYIIGIFAVISIIYGALNAVYQKDLKKMIAYSSVSHMGYAMLGIAAFTVIYGNENKIALLGSTMQMISHGLITAALFFAVGMLYRRTHERNMEMLGGLYKTMPVLGGFFIFFSFASMGLPGLSGFISEFLILLGSFNVYFGLTIIAIIGLILTATYFLRAIYKTLMGEPNKKFLNLKDLLLKEKLILSILVILIIFVGIYPTPIINLFLK